MLTGDSQAWGQKIMVWGAMTSEGTGPLFWIKTIMDSKVYHNILVNHLMPYVKQFNDSITPGKITSSI
jgi:hypothetical protein